MAKTLRRSREVGKINPTSLSAETTITSNSFAVTSYRGNSRRYSLGGLGFSPSLIWIKNRVQLDNHKISDSIRTVPRIISTNLSTSGSAEVNDEPGVQAFDSNGFTIGPGANGFNDGGEEFVAFSWKEDPSFGFDIVLYTGTGASRTVAHSLGSVPSLIIIKNRSSNVAWAIYHSSISSPETSSLSFGTAVPAAKTYWNNILPTPADFSLGADTQVNGLNGAHVAYLFAPVAGKSAFGSYTGNGSTSGPTININFTPKLIIIKRVDVADIWVMVDILRGGSKILSAGTTASENTNATINFLADGFQIISTTASVNATDGSYIYSAWA